MMSKRNASRDVKHPAEDRYDDRHPKTFRDRPIEAIVSVVILALLGGLVATGVLLVD